MAETNNLDTTFDAIAQQNAMAARLLANAEAARREQAAIAVRVTVAERHELLDAAAHHLALADVRWSRAKGAQRDADREMAAAEQARREARIAYNRAIDRVVDVPDTITDEETRP